MGSGPGDRNQEPDYWFDQGVLFRPQWGPAPGTGIRGRRPQVGGPRLRASMGSGPGDRNQLEQPQRRRCDHSGLASMGSGPGDRNQFPGLELSLGR